MNKYSSKSKLMLCSMALAVTALAAGCGGGSGGGGAAGGAAGVPFSTTNNSTAAGAVNLGTAASFVILAKTGVSTTGTTDIEGHVGVSPVAETFLTGFSQARALVGTYATSSLVTGFLYSADMAVPTPTQMTTAISDMELAYTAADDATAGVGANLNLGGGTLANETLAPGTYTWGSNVNITTNLSLSGGPTDVYIFQISGNLTQDSGTRITLPNGALPKNIFWQVAGAAAIGTTAHFEGILLSKTNIALNTGATMNGRLLAQTAVTLDANAVTQP